MKISVFQNFGLCYYAVFSIKLKIYLDEHAFSNIYLSTEVKIALKGFLISNFFTAIFTSLFRKL